MFITALFRIARTWKQPKSPSEGEWVSRLWYRQTTDYHSVLKRNDLLSYEEIWKKLKCIFLSE